MDQEAVDLVFHRRLECSMDTPLNHPKHQVPMVQNLEVANFLTVMAVLGLVVLDFQEDRVVLGQSLDILLELEWGLGAFHLLKLKLPNTV